MTDTTTEFQSELVSVSILRAAEDQPDGVPYECPAESTPTPGLAITPSLNEYGFRGRWVVTHIASGRHIGVEFDSIDGAREFAERLGAVPGVDWANPDMAATVEATKKTEAADAIRKAVKAAREADKPWVPWEGF